MNDNAPDADRHRKPDMKTHRVVSKTIRAVTALIVFGIPLVAGTAVVVGYGAYEAYKKLKRPRR